MTKCSVCVFQSKHMCLNPSLIATSIESLLGSSTFIRNLLELELALCWSKVIIDLFSPSSWQGKSSRRILPSEESLLQDSSLSLLSFLKSWRSERWLFRSLLLISSFVMVWTNGLSMHLHIVWFGFWNYLWDVMKKQKLYPQIYIANANGNK